jgi:hypothetical protein
MVVSFIKPFAMIFAKNLVKFFPQKIDITLSVVNSEPLVPVPLAGHSQS